MRYLSGMALSSGSIHWQYFSVGGWDDEKGVKVQFHLSPFRKQYQRRQAIKEIEKLVTTNQIKWITPGVKEWTFDLDTLQSEFDPFADLDWMTGKVKIEPEFETFKEEVFGESRYKANVAFYLMPEVLTTLDIYQLEPPIEIRESLQRFRAEYPDETKVAFIMMQFGSTKAHTNIVKGIKNVLTPLGITPLQADDKQYHDDLFSNVLTYIWSCSFGIAVFERIEAEDFNPNVSLEVGYMFALRKPVCLLKDKTLKVLHTDLVGKIYRTFDPQHPIKSIAPELTQWLEDKDIA